MCSTLPHQVLTKQRVLIGNMALEERASKGHLLSANPCNSSFTYIIEGNVVLEKCFAGKSASKRSLCRGPLEGEEQLLNEWWFNLQ